MTDRFAGVAQGLVFALVAGTTAAALGQSPVTVDSGWVLVPAGGTTPHPYAEYVRTGTASAAGGGHLVLARPQIVRTGLSAGVTHDGMGPVDRFAYAVSFQRDFQIVESATINLSNMLDGFFSFSGGGGANNIPAGMRAELTVLRRNAQGVYVPTGIEATLSPSGSAANLPGRVGLQVVNNLLRVSSGTLNFADGTDYRVVATMRIDAAGTAGTVVGSEVTVDTRAGNRSGQAASLAVLPLNYNGDSRAAIGLGGVVNYELSGQGVRIGMIEGNPFAHVSLAGRVVLRNGPLAPTGQHQSEHALAVAGIMASASGDAGAQGVAPGATVYSAALGTWGSGRAVLTDLLGEGVSVVNMSIGFPPEATAGDFSTVEMNRWMTSHPLMTLVVSIGNDGPPGANASTVSPPATSDSVIAVGAVNRTFTRRAEFSSYSDGATGRRPDLVAPGEFILAPGQRDVDGNGSDDDFRRFFIGSDFDHVNPASGDVSGTSFAAPFVTGTVALLHEYAAANPGTHDATSIDSRVMKAVLMNTATTEVRRSNGNAWQQASSSVPMIGFQGRFTTLVSRSVDDELGAGMLNVERAIEMFARPEVRAADNTTSRNMRIDVTDNAASVPMFWDRQAIRGASATAIATVEYALGVIGAGGHFRATLAWIDEVERINGHLVDGYSQLNLGLFREVEGNGNLPGYDPAHPFADMLIAGTNEATGVTRLLDLEIPTTGRYYLIVLNQSGVPATISECVYGLSVYIPAPGGGGVLLVAGVFALRRRR